MKKFSPFCVFVLNKSIISVVMVMAFAACKKNSGPSAPTADVYLAGNIFSADGTTTAMYWKNGNIVPLPGPAKNGMAMAITVVGKDVYVAGITFNTSADAVPTYWKNGIATSLSIAGTHGEANSIAVSGNDVYVVGYTMDNSYTGTGVDNPMPIYWKNGIADTLPYSGIYAQPTGIATDGKNVYISGYSADNISATALYWNNGVVTKLGLGLASAIAVSGTDVYVAGSVLGGGPLTYIYFPFCWKNGAAMTSPGAYQGSGSPNGISLTGSDVYMVGTCAFGNGDYAGYWKNGILHSFSPGFAKAIAISGNDVYVAGASLSPNGTAVTTLWKNDVPTALPKVGNVTALAIVAAQ